MEKSTISLAREHRSYLTSCFSCKSIWIQKNPPEEFFHEINSMVSELNQQRPSVQKLFDYNIFIDHVLCQECMKNYFHFHENAGGYQHQASIALEA